MARLAERAADEIRACSRAPAAGEVTVSGEFGSVEGDEVCCGRRSATCASNALEACLEAGRPPRIAVEGQEIAR